MVSIIIYMWAAKAWRNWNSDPFQSITKSSFQSKRINEVLLFYPNGEHCFKCLKQKKTCDRFVCHYKNALIIKEMLCIAKKSIDICVCLITLDFMIDTLIDIHRKGIVIRFIVDRGMQECAYKSSSVLLRLLKEKFPLRLSSGSSKDSLMHCKFVIIDDNILLNGSLNWTRQGFFGNIENMIITNEPNIVTEFVKFFQYLWDKSDLKLLNH